MRIQPVNLKSVVSASAINGFDAFPAKPANSSLPRFAFISPRVISAFARFVEVMVVILSGWGLAAIHPAHGALITAQLYLPLIISVGIALPILLQVTGRYSIRSLLNPLGNMSKIAMCWSLLFAAIAVGLIATKAADSYSRIWLGAWYVSGFASLAMARLVLSTRVKHWNLNGRLSRQAIIVGGGKPALHLHDAFRDMHDTDINLVGIFDDRGNSRISQEFSGLPRLGNVSELIDFVRRERVDLLLVSLPLMAEERLLQILKQLWVLPVDIRLSAQNQKLRYRPRAYSYVGNVPFLDVFDKPLDDWGAIIKVCEDKIIAFFALLLLSPLMLLIALVVKLDSKGPVMFKQKRYGFNNELIEVYKFRSMYHEQADHNAERLAIRNDNRITSVGAFIRRTSMDELPQLLNVLFGSLSLVGPRPHATRAKAAEKLYTDVVDGYFARHKVKPGITGWAQINGWRGETDTVEKIERRVEHDLYYIENWSLALDLYILARTPFALLNTENAY